MYNYDDERADMIFKTVIIAAVLVIVFITAVAITLLSI